MKRRFIDTLTDELGRMFGGILDFRYHVDDSGNGFIIAADQGGFIVRQDDFQELIAFWGRFYEIIPDEYLEAVNQKTWASYFEPSTEKTISIFPETKSDPSGYVYILGGGGYYKIGKSINVPKRIDAISPKLPFEVELVHTIPTNDRHWAEKRIHERFAHRRANGEWFKLEPLEIAWLLNTKEMNRDES